MSSNNALIELLLAMPSDGAWMCGSGPHRTILTRLLDENSPLVEEDVMPDNEVDAAWMVRLTAAGMAIRAAVVAATVKPFQKTEDKHFISPTNERDDQRPRYDPLCAACAFCASGTRHA